MTHLNFSWSAPTTYENGATITDSLTYNLYENGSKVVTDIAALNFSLVMDGKSPGVYTYTVTAVDVATSLESVQSAPVQVSFIAPKSPENFVYTLVVS